jgi:GAF domain-containing protein
MCLPIRQGGRLEGVLYLENNLADASFTEERVEFPHAGGAGHGIDLARPAARQP